MKICKPLNDYSFFVEEVRNGKNQTDNLEEAIDNALKKLPDDSVIKPFLLANKAEVKHMCITEYDEERTFAEWKEDCIEVVIEKGKKDVALNLLKLKTMTEEVIANATGLSIEQIHKLAEEL